MRMRSIPAICAMPAVLAACATGGIQSNTTSTQAPPTTPPAKAVTAVVTPSTQASRTESWIDLKVGECVTNLPPADLSRITVTVVDCGTAHLAEVYLRAPMAVDNAIANVANKDCAAGFTPYTGQPVDAGPLSMSWLIDSKMDRTGTTPMPSTVICLLQAANGQLLTGSAHH
jgi:hypothetical protein